MGVPSSGGIGALSVFSEAVNILWHIPIRELMLSVGAPEALAISSWFSSYSVTEKLSGIYAESSANMRVSASADGIRRQSTQMIAVTSLRVLKADILFPMRVKKAIIRFMQSPPCQSLY